MSVVAWLTPTATGVRSTPAVAGHEYRAKQRLCTESPLSPPVVATDELNPPVLISPICPEEQTLTLRHTALNAIVVVYRVINAPPAPTRHRNGGGGAPGNLELSLYQPNGLTLTSATSSTPAKECARHRQDLQSQSRAGHRLPQRSSRSTTTTAAPAPTYTKPCCHQPRWAPGDSGGSTNATSTDRLLRRSSTPAMSSIVGAESPEYVFRRHSTNTVYAFDADDHNTGPDTAPLWMRALG